jgi:hypothetical protein
MYVVSLFYYDYFKYNLYITNLLAPQSNFNTPQPNQPYNPTSTVLPNYTANLEFGMSGGSGMKE